MCKSILKKKETRLLKKLIEINENTHNVQKYMQSEEKLTKKHKMYKNQQKYMQKE